MFSAVRLCKALMHLSVCMERETELHSFEEAVNELDMHSFIQRCYNFIESLSIMHLYIEIER